MLWSFRCLFLCQLTILDTYLLFEAGVLTVLASLLLN